MKLFATLRKHLPADATNKTTTLVLEDGQTVADALRRLGVPAQEAHLILVNGLNKTPEQSLVEGDVVAVFPPVAGG